MHKPTIRVIRCSPRRHPRPISSIHLSSLWTSSPGEAISAPAPLEVDLSLLIIGLLLHLSVVLALASQLVTSDCWNQVDKERQDVEGEDEGYGPFEDCRGVVNLLLGGDAECYCEGHFDDDKCEFGPEGGSENAMFTEICYQLVLYYHQVTSSTYGYQDAGTPNTQRWH